MGLDALKGLAAKNTNTKSKTKSDVVVLDPALVSDAEQEWIKANAQISEGKALKEQAEQTIGEYAIPLWMNHCRESGVVSSSCAVGRVRLTNKGRSQFAAKSSLDAERLRAVFGDEEYETYFEEQEGPMQLTPEALANNEIVERLTALISDLAKEFPGTQIVSYNTQVSPKDVLFHDWVMRADKHDELEAKFRSSGLKRTKTTFASR